MKYFTQYCVVVFLICLVVASNLTAQNQDSIVFRYLGPDGGIVTSVKGLDNDSVVLAGTRNKGILRTIDGGASWVATSMISGKVNQIVFHPSNPKNVYAATDQGLYLSEDIGATWNPLTQSPVWTVAIYPIDPNIIFVGDGRSTLVSKGIMRSVDGGKNWTAMNEGLTNSRTIRSIAIDPKDRRLIVYAGTDSAGVFVSTNGGTSWTTTRRMGTGTNAQRVHTLWAGNFRSTPVIIAGTSGGLFAQAWAPPLQSTWISISNGMSDSIVQTMNVVLIDTTSIDNNAVYVGTVGNEPDLPPKGLPTGMYKVSSQVTTPSWGRLFESIFDINSIFVPLKNPEKVYIASSDGIFISANGGLTMNRSNAGYTNALTYTVAPASQDSNIIFAGCFGGGVKKTTDGGKTWNPMNKGIQNPYVTSVAIDPRDDYTVYAANTFNVFKSINGGVSWANLNLPIWTAPPTNPDPFNYPSVLRISPVNSRYLLYSSAAGLFLSMDAGASWSRILNFPVPYIFLPENIEFDPRDANTIYLAETGLWKSTNLGTTWSDITGNLPRIIISGQTALPMVGMHPTVNPFNRLEIYLPRYSVGDIALQKTYKTNDGGKNWTTLPVGLVDVSVPEMDTTGVFGVNQYGVYRSSDKGDSWLRVTPESYTPNLVSLTASINNDNLFYCGSPFGVYFFSYPLIKIKRFPKISLDQTHVDFGTLQVGARAVASISIENEGNDALIVRDSIFSGSDVFSFLDGGTKTLEPGGKKIYRFGFSPSNSGSKQASVVFVTNDVKAPQFTITLQGSGVTKAIVKRRVLIDLRHGFDYASGDTLAFLNHMSTFLASLQNSGIEVVYQQSAFDPSGFDLLILAVPKLAYNADEIGKMQKYVVDGGSIVILGDADAGTANANINKILQDFRWRTDLQAEIGMSIGKGLLVDSVDNFRGFPTSPVLTGFADLTHPLLKGVDTLVVFGGSRIIVTGSAIPFLRGNKTTIQITDDSTAADTSIPVAIGYRQVGKGKILLIGDLDIWANGEIFGGIVAKKNLQFALNVFSVVDNYEVKLPQPTPREQYRIITIPFDLKNFNIFDALKDLGMPNPVNWRLYGRWNENTGKYAEFPSAEFSEFRRGEGYWLITRGEYNISFGAAIVTSPSGYFPIKLVPGYNLIGNPFPYRVSWANSIKSSQVESRLWKYDGKVFTADTIIMEPFQGYFVRSWAQDTLTIYINPGEFSGTLPKAQSEDEQFAKGEWKFQIKANNGKATDEDNYAGVRQAASEEWDTFDYSEPPVAPSDYLMLSFNHKNWTKRGARYGGDFRPVHNDGQFWDFDIASAKDNTSIDLTFNTMGQLPADFRAYLVDMTTERANDITTTLSYSSKLKKNEYNRSFRLLVGKQEYVEKNTNGIPLVPLEYSLEQNYPNPFNPNTTIRYSLGHSGVVTLDIYDLLGRKVRSLYHGFQPIGTYSVTWDATNSNGVSVASGVYCYRLSVDEFKANKRMILLK